MRIGKVDNLDFLHKEKLENVRAQADVPLTYEYVRVF